MRLIDADALKEWAVNTGCGGRWGISLDDLTDAIESAPTIDPVKHGKWIFENRTWFHQPLLKCSCCGRRQFVARFDYCPYCGAKMDEVDDEIS